MTAQVGRNRNTNDTTTVTTYTINSATATTISAANEKRTHFRVDLSPGTNDRNVAVREYPASTDNVFHGNVLTRRTGSNDALFNSFFEMPEASIYTGEVSAITDGGTTDIYVSER